MIVNQIVFEEPLITESKKPHLRRLIYSTESSMLHSLFRLQRVIVVVVPFRADGEAGSARQRGLLSVQNSSCAHLALNKLRIQQVGR